MFIGLEIAVWIVTGVLSYGIWVDYWKRSFDYFAVGLLVGLFVLATGPFSLLAAICVHEGPYGFDLRPYTREERWRNFNAKYNTLTYTHKTREQFDEEY
jgi:hypothetical protein